MCRNLPAPSDFSKTEALTPISHVPAAQMNIVEKVRLLAVLRTPVRIPDGMMEADGVKAPQAGPLQLAGERLVGKQRSQHPLGGQIDGVGMPRLLNNCMSIEYPSMVKPLSLLYARHRPS